MNLLSSPYFLLFMAITLWSGNFVLGRAFHADIPPVALNFLRWVVAGLVLLPFAGAAVWKARGVLLARWRLVLVLSFLGFATYNTLVYVSLGFTTTFNAVIMMSVTPVAIPLMDLLINKERLTMGQAGGIVLSLSGAGVVVFQGDLSHLTDLRFGTGEIIMFVAMLIWALYSVLLRRAPSDVPAMALLFVMIWLGLVLLAPVYLWELSEVGGVAFTQDTLLVLGYVSLFAALSAYWLWSKGVAAVGPVKAGLFIHLLPVISAFLAYLFLGETLGGYHAVGAALILMGLVLTARTGNKHNPPERG